MVGVGVAMLIAGSIGASTASADGSAGYFSALTPSGDTQLQSPRFLAVSASLPDGDVLIAGGRDNSGNAMQSAELFDPATDTFTALPATGNTELQTARAGAIAASLPNGKVLIAGGQTVGGTLVLSAELFNPITDTFTALTASGNTELQAVRFLSTAASLPDHDVLIAGGLDSGGSTVRTAELFDPANNTFTALPATGNTELSTARDGAVAASLPNGQVLISGGYAVQNSELFNPVSGTFTSLPASADLPAPVGFVSTATSLPNGQVLAAGGSSANIGAASAALFNPGSETFTQLPAPGNTELQTAREGAVAALLPNGQVLIAGGSTDGQNGGDLSSAELYTTAPAAAGGTFGSQTVSQPAPQSVITVTNVGGPSLSISGTSLAGTDASDFLIAADACTGRTLSFGQSCTITAGFTADSAGAKSATITLADDQPSATVINLTGTGVAPNSGPTGPTGPIGATGGVGATGDPGATGGVGATGVTGATGGPGANGATGAPGAAGANGMVELVTCKTVVVGTRKHHKTVKRCSARLTSAPLKFTATAGSARVVLSRNGIIYATGRAVHSGTQVRMLLTPVQRIHRGTYTLRLTHGHRTRSSTITIT